MRTEDAQQIGGEPMRGGGRVAGRHRDESGLAGVGVSATADGAQDKGVGARRRGVSGPKGSVRPTSDVWNRSDRAG